MNLRTTETAGATRRAPGIHSIPPKKRKVNVIRQLTLVQRWRKASPVASEVVGVLAHAATDRSFWSVPKTERNCDPAACRPGF
jgi:hypothetical protein